MAKKAVKKPTAKKPTTKPAGVTPEEEAEFRKANEEFVALIEKLAKTIGSLGDKCKAELERRESAKQLTQESERANP